MRVSFTDDADNERNRHQCRHGQRWQHVPTDRRQGPTDHRRNCAVGETLATDVLGIADEDGLENATFSYQWISNDGTTDADIQGETGATYTLTDANEGKTVKVRYLSPTTRTTKKPSPVPPRQRWQHVPTDRRQEHRSSAELCG